MSKLSIRSAKKSDAVAIEKMIYKWIRWHRERSETIRKALHHKNHQILVAESDGKVIGVLHPIFHLDILHGGYNSHINLFLVDEEHRGRGVGSQLLDKAIRTAREKGAIEVHVDTIYEEAEEFYRKRGFRDDGVMQDLVL
jgi:GNAT superfamily N-acetyltransferase